MEDGSTEEDDDGMKWQ